VQEQEHKNLSSKKDVGDKTGTLGINEKWRGGNTMP